MGISEGRAPEGRVQGTNISVKGYYLKYFSYDNEVVAIQKYK